MGDRERLLVCSICAAFFYIEVLQQHLPPFTCQKIFIVAFIHRGTLVDVRSYPPQFDEHGYKRRETYAPHFSHPDSFSGSLSCMFVCRICRIRATIPCERSKQRHAQRCASGNFDELSCPRNCQCCLYAPLDAW